MTEWMLAGRIVVVGISVVFITLALLVGVIKILGIFTGERKVEEKGRMEEEERETGEFRENKKIENSPVSRKFRIMLGEKEYKVEVEGKTSGEDLLPSEKIGKEMNLKISDLDYRITVEDLVGIREIREPKIEKEVEGTPIKAPMQGTIIKIKVKVGDRIKPGDVIGILEAMKMENEIESTLSGIVKSIPVSEGASVSTGDVLVWVGK